MARETLRALAREFPGCLRELDVLGLPELLRRRDAAERAAAGGPTEPWMAWIGAYHALMRATLHLKVRLARRTTPRTGPPAAALAREASLLCGIALDAPFVRAVADPPHGRLGVVVMRRLAALFGEPAEAIARALFPVRRPSPYTYEGGEGDGAAGRRRRRAAGRPRPGRGMSR